MGAKCAKSSQSGIAMAARGLDSHIATQRSSKVNKQPQMTFALAGELVSTPAQARRILRDAKRNYKDWIIPQAASVLRQLLAARHA